MPSRLLFAYGTLNLDEVQRWVWGEAKHGRVAQLTDFKLKSYDNNIFYVDKEFGETVSGKVYELTEEQLNKTDLYEGKAYSRETVNIDGKVVNVYVRKKDITV